MHLHRTFPLIVFFCLGILVATGEDRAACESLQTNEIFQLLQAEEANTVSFQENVRFTGLNGEETIVLSGTYKVEPVALTTLRLVPFGAKDTFVVKAAQTRHDEDIRSPVALLVLDDQYLIHVVLLLPEHKGLEAIGSSSPGHSRGGPRLLTREQIRDALTRKNASKNR